MLRFFPPFERIIIVALLVIVAFSSVYLYRRYVRDHAELIAVDGGIYTEGVVGRPFFLNPALLSGNSVDRDISQLIFSGLTRYNPHTGVIEDDIATSEKSKDDLTYTFTLVPDAFWHDGTPVTADDVIFTYRDVFQNKDSTNAALRQTFSDVIVTKKDERTVSFQLSEPDSFFLANVTIGLLPKHYLEFIPVQNLDKSEFNKQPIGTGPYRFSDWNVLNDTHEITLQKFDDYYGALPKIQTVIFRAFPDYPSLLLAENTLSGFRVQSGHSPDEVLSSVSRFSSFPYKLPQYTALFLNTDSGILSNKKVRFALLLATDKDEIASLVQDAEVVDTPILESKADLDIEFSIDRSRGAFFDTEWNLPRKLLEDKNIDSQDKNNLSTGGPEDAKLIQTSEKLTFDLIGVQDTWLSLSVDSVSQKSFLLKTGNKRTFTATKSISFSTIGNAAGLKVEVNGIVLKSFGSEGVVLRNLVLDRKSLTEYIVEKLESSGPADEIKINDSSEKILGLDDIEDSKKSLDSTPDEVSDELGMVRINDSGERLILRLVTAQEPSTYLDVAEIIQRQWLQAGAKVVIETYSLPELQKKISARDYDILLFGQNLGYNLDAFPFWHSSQAESGLNLSQYRSLEVDKLLVDVRHTFDDRTKQELLDRLMKTIASDTPAIFLYNPVHYYLVDSSVKNVELSHLSSHSDRLTDLMNWYIREDFQLSDKFSFGELFRWIFAF